MADLRKDIDTVVIVMMENRSFDHMLGYLNLPGPGRMAVEGLQDDPNWRARFSNPYKGGSYQPFHMAELALTADPPHERKNIALQIGDPIGGTYSMTGFVQSYDRLDPLQSGFQPAVMGYYTDREIPITDFFARSFAVCDKWFSSIPASTHPNRLMALSGETRIEGNAYSLPDQYLVYDWLNDNHVNWRVYHEGIPFIALMPRWIPHILGESFRGFGVLGNDIMNESDATFPEVIFIEPTYTNAPHVGDPSDDHAPSSIGGGQEFLRKVYLSFMMNPERFSRTVIIVTYDEHGGFFDHVSPVPISTDPPRAASYLSFACSGVRVPAFVISPLVSAGQIYSQPLDHTSILRFLAEKFGGDEPYSAEVERRHVEGFGGRIADVLDLSAARPDCPFPPGSTPEQLVNAIAFRTAAAALTAHDPNQATNKFPELRHFIKSR